MKLILPLLLLVTITAAFIQTKAEKYVFWSFDSHLQWSDFRGHMKAEDDHAASASYLGFLHKMTKSDHADSVLMDTRAFFNRNSSWVKAPAVNPGLLLHEQLHFVLTELHARKFRKALLDMDIKESRLSRVVDSVYKYYSTRCDSMNFVYDVETNHGLNAFGQFRWSGHIRADLLEMNAYEAPYIKFSLKRGRKEK